MRWRGSQVKSSRARYDGPVGRFYGKIGWASFVPGQSRDAEEAWDFRSDDGETIRCPRYDLELLTDRRQKEES